MRARSSLASAAVASSLLAACVSTSSPPVAPEDAGLPGEDAGFDATLPDSGADAAPGLDAADARAPGDAADANDGAAPLDASDGATSDASDAGSGDASVACTDAGTGRCLVVLATSQSNPEGLVLHGGYLYWIEEGLPQHVYRALLPNGAPEDLGAAGVPSSYSGALFVDTTNMYWNDQYNAAIYTAPNTGIPDAGPSLITALDGGGVTSMLIANASVYWTDYNAGKVYGAPLTAAGAAPSVVASPGGTPYGIATDGTTLYWANTTASAIQAISLVDGGAEYTLQAGVTAPTLVTVQAGTLYFSSESAFDVYAMPVTGMTDGGLPQVFVATGSATASSFAYDGVNVYWTTPQNPGGEVLYAAPGQTGTPVALGMTSPGSLVFDSTNIYWANGAYGAVFTMAKP